MTRDAPIPILLSVFVPIWPYRLISVSVICNSESANTTQIIFMLIISITAKLFQNNRYICKNKALWTTQLIMYKRLIYSNKAVTKYSEQSPSRYTQFTLIEQSIKVSIGKTNKLKFSQNLSIRDLILGIGIGNFCNRYIGYRNIGKNPYQCTSTHDSKITFTERPLHIRVHILNLYTLMLQC